MSAQGAGVSAQGGVSGSGVYARGECLPRGGVVHLTPPVTEFLTHTCENITFPQLRLRTVNMISVGISVTG